MTDRTLSGYRIVIVEDDYYQAQDCRQLLEAAGAKVIAVSATVPDLSALLEEGRIDAVLIDINLGHGLSFDFARELKARAIPFVFLTGYDAVMLPDDLAGSGYLTKPADARRIMAALLNAAGGSR
ncbi:response regulator [Erythrobacter oryzae]|uniref:response regulator n=1 Tax=Erythrobacter oryzae TaxID=3019556 RepID=UPI002553654F|nr:response regulator [Erythrobacter sp. COR-2]